MRLGARAVQTEKLAKIWSETPKARPMEVQVSAHLPQGRCCSEMVKAVEVEVEVEVERQLK
jgi:hypothetical protein